MLWIVDCIVCVCVLLGVMCGVPVNVVGRVISPRSNMLSLTPCTLIAMPGSPSPQDHNDFGGVGMAVPDRIKLFRAQTLRSVGGNGRRMSHNPPEPMMLDICMDVSTRAL